MADRQLARAAPNLAGESNVSGPRTLTSLASLPYMDDDG